MVNRSSGQHVFTISVSGIVALQLQQTDVHKKMAQVLSQYPLYSQSANCKQARNFESCY